MTQSFDAGRWWLLVGKHWSENRKKYSLSLIAMGGLLIFWYTVALMSDRNGIAPQLQLNTYYVGLFGVGCFYASLLFADLGSKTKRLNFLTVPASHLEKLLCMLFYGVVAFFVCYTAIFYAVDIVMVKIGNSIMYSHWIKNHQPADVFFPREINNVFSSPDGHHQNQPGFVYYLLLFYFVLQAVFILGSVYFAKFSFIKTVIASLLIGLLIVFILAKVIFPILPQGDYYHGITSYHVYTVKDLPAGSGIMVYSDNATDKIITLPQWISDVLFFMLKFAFAPLFWLATYFRLKEKEI